MKKGFIKMSAAKKFLTTLLATTISIVLTFGTTAIIDRRKKKVEKRELVMMILYDMRESLNEIGQCVKDVKEFCDLQVDLVAHPDRFSDDYALLYTYIPMLRYTTTTENIFKSNIETMNTIGNILFVETVSSFYDTRNKFKTDVAEEFIRDEFGFSKTYESLSAFNAPSFTLIGETYYQLMRRDYEESKLMMKVSEDDLDVFSRQREKLKDKLLEQLGETPADATVRAIQEREQRDQALEKAREEGRKATY